MNLDKLLRLADAHAALVAQARLASSAAREAAGDAARLAMEIAGDDPDGVAEATLARADLAEMPDADLEAAGIRPDLLRAYLVRQARAVRLRGVAADLAEQSRASRLLLDNLQAYARRRGEHVTI